MLVLFASQNQNKTTEIRKILPAGITLESLVDYNFRDDIPETGLTLIENALIKARFVWQRFGQPCFADDSGLEVEALHGAPGVFSARYAGEEKSADKNMQKLLLEIENIPNRKACFKTVIALIVDGKEFIFEGRVDGEITFTRRGDSGFGYDPIFIPDGYDRTFAEMSLDEKNKISHRGRALEKLVSWLRKAN